MTHEVPLVPKENVTVLSIGDSLEAVAVRSILESYNYRVTVHWIGSRKELIEILKGSIETDQTIVLSCHGTEEGIVVPGEPVLGAKDVTDVASLQGKTIVNLGCLTGSPAFAEAFKKAGTKAYIAPVDYPEGRAAIGFIANLFLLLASKHPLDEAVRRAAAFDAETKQFKLFE